MTDLAGGNDLGGGGGAAAASTVWDGRVVPEGLHATSDEFDEDTLATGKWQLWDHGGNLSASIDTANRCMVLESTGDGATVEWCGVYQPKPSNLFSFAARLAFHSPMGTGAFNPIAGLGVFTNATAAAGDGAIWGDIEFERDSNASQWNLRVRDGVAWNGATGFDTRTMNDQLVARWLRGRIAISVGNFRIEGDWSEDGYTWNPYRAQTGSNGRTRGTGVLTAQHFGLTFLQFPASLSRVVVQHFRVWDGVNTFDTVPRNGGYL